MAKYNIVTIQGAGIPVEASRFVDAGHEGKWIDFQDQRGGKLVTVFRIRSGDVQKIELQD